MSKVDDIEDAKQYMARKELFQLFESLLTAVVHHRPEEPIPFLQMCLDKAKEEKTVTWDSFLSIVDDKQNKSSQANIDIGTLEKFFDTELDPGKHRLQDKIRDGPFMLVTDFRRYDEIEPFTIYLY